MSTRMRLRERIKRVSKPSGARIVEEVSRRYGGKDDDDGDEEPIKARRRLLFSTGKGKEEADVDADDPILDDDPEDEDWDDNNNRRKSSKKHVDEIEDDDVVLVGPSHSARDQDVFDDDAGPVRAGKRPLVSPAPQIAPAPAAPAKKKADENYKKAMKRPRPRAPSQWKEQQVTIDDRYKVVKTNKIYIESLIVSLQYLDSIEPADQILRDRDAIRVALVEAVKIQNEWAPVRSAAPTRHLAPPDIPAADGTEVRFTNVANSMGIHWREVPEADKIRVYQRAAELHEEVFGVRPPKVMMHTNEGFKPTSYYNNDTYRQTMVRALEEYEEGSLGPQLLNFLDDPMLQ